MNTLNARWCSEGPLGAPPLSEPFDKGVLLQANGTRPLGHGHRFAIKSNPGIVPAIVVLLGGCCPSAIIRRITLVVVDAIKRVVRAFPFTHVGEKVLEREPSLAHCNSSSAVVSVVSVPRIKTSLLHRGPRLIGRRFFSVCGVSVTSIQNFCLAMAAFDVGSSHVRNKSFPFLAAKIAFEKPLHIPVMVDGVTEKREAPELSSCLNIFGFWHPGHFVIIPELGYEREIYYGQHEQKIAYLVDAYQEAGGDLSHNWTETV